MRYLLLFPFFFFVGANTTQAQCDPKQYASIFSEALTLQAQGQFIEAKNKFAASKIYACSDRQQVASDEAIDSLFGQIDLLRRSEKVYREKAETESKRYLAMRDTAIQERLRADVLIDAFRLKQEGDIAFQLKDINSANDYYQQSLMKLDFFTNLEEVSVERTLKRQLEEKLAEVIRLSELYQQHKRLIEEGDQFAKNKTLFIKSYKPYIQAWKLEVDSKQALDRLKDLELIFNQNKDIKKRLKGLAYYDFLNCSAEANLILGNPAVAFKRMNRVLKCRPNNLDFIENNTLKQYVITNKKKIKTIRECYLVSRWYLNAKAPSKWSPGYSFGTKINFGSKFILGSEVFFRHLDSNNVSTKFLDQIEASVFGEYKLYKALNRKWLSNCFEVRAVAGLSFGQASYNSPIHKLPDIEQILALKGQVSLDTFAAVRSYDGGIEYKGIGDSSIEFHTYINPNSTYLNIFVGLNFNYTPFPKIPYFSFNATINYNFQVYSNREDLYYIKEPILIHFNKKYGLSIDELEEFRMKLDKANMPETLTVNGFSPEVFSKINFKFGFLYSF